MKWLRACGIGLFVLAWVNAAAAFALTLAWGGDAISGRQQDGRFYLSSHGQDTEVSEDRWRVSRAHHASVCVILPLGVAALLASRWAVRHRTTPDPTA